MIGRDFHLRTLFGSRLQSRRDVLKAAALTSVAGYTAVGVTTGAGSSQFGQIRNMAIQATATENTLATHTPESDGTEEGIVDPAAIIMAVVPTITRVGGQIVEGVKINFGRPGLVEGAFLTEDQLAILPPSFNSIIRLQMYGFHPDDPSIYTLNGSFCIYIFDNKADARLHIDGINGPWSGANIVPEDQIEVSGLDIQWYEYADPYQPSLTNRTWHFTEIVNGQWVFEGAIASVNPEIDLALINDIAAASKRAGRELQPNLRWGDYVIPPPTNQFNIVPRIWDGELLPIVGADPADAEYDAVFGGGAESMFTLALQTVDEFGSPAFLNQSTIGFADSEACGLYFNQIPNMYPGLDEQTGIRRQFIDQIPEILLGTHGEAWLNEFLIDAQGTTYGGVELIILNESSVNYSTVLSPDPMPATSFDELAANESFVKQNAFLQYIEELRGEAAENSAMPWIGVPPSSQ